MLLDKLQAIKIRWQDVEKELSAPETVSDRKLFAKLSKEYKNLSQITEKYEEYKHVMSNYDSAKEILSKEKDEEFRQMAKAETEELEKKKENLEEEIRNMLIPADPEDDKNCVMEIRAGTGGDEASIFAGDLYRMYMRYCENRGWKTELADYSEGTAGGFKEAVINITGDGSYGQLKYESGVHRVQRVPDTETQGRVHTSAATVVVLPSLSESFGVVLTEAMAMEKPVIATKVGGVTEVVENGRTGILVNKENVEELAMSIINVLSDKKRAINMGKEGRKRALSFDRKIFAQKVLDEFKKLL